MKRKKPIVRRKKNPRDQVVIFRLTKKSMVELDRLTDLYGAENRSDFMRAYVDAITSGNIEDYQRFVQKILEGMTKQSMLRL